VHLPVGGRGVFVCLLFQENFMKRIDLGAALALWALLPGSLTTAHAGTGTEALRVEFARKLAALQQEYEARLQQLEAREALPGAAGMVPLVVTTDIVAEGRAQDDHEHVGHDGHDGHDHDGDDHSHGEGHAGSAVMAGAAAAGSPQVGLLLQGRMSRGHRRPQHQDMVFWPRRWRAAVVASAWAGRR
jgi:hypothetical protein